MEHCKDGDCGHAKDMTEYRKGFAAEVLEKASDDYIRSEAMKRGILPDTIKFKVAS